MRFTNIDLSKLPLPTVIEPLSYETVLAEIVAVFQQRWAAIRQIDGTLPDYDVHLVESDPVITVLEAFAAREMALRARINDAARAVMVPTSIGTDLDNLAALFKVERLEGETDARFRLRLQAAIEAYSSAGPRDAYIYHALTAVPELRDVSATMTSPGNVLIVCLLDDLTNPTPSAAQLQAVRERLSGERVRPLTDSVVVTGPRIVETNIKARLTLYPGPSSAAVVTAASQAIGKLLNDNRYLGRDLKRSAVIAKLHQDGVHSVVLDEPAADIVVDYRQFVRVTTLSIEVVGVDE